MAIYAFEICCMTTTIHIRFTTNASIKSIYVAYYIHKTRFKWNYQNATLNEFIKFIIAMLHCNK